MYKYMPIVIASVLKWASAEAVSKFLDFGDVPEFDERALESRSYCTDWFRDFIYCGPSSYPDIEALNGESDTDCPEGQIFTNLMRTYWYHVNENDNNMEPVNVVQKGKCIEKLADGEFCFESRCVQDYCDQYELLVPFGEGLCQSGVYEEVKGFAYDYTAQKCGPSSPVEGQIEEISWEYGTKKETSPADRLVEETTPTDRQVKPIVGDSALTYDRVEAKPPSNDQKDGKYPAGRQGEETIPAEGQVEELRKYTIGEYLFDF